MHPNDLNSRVSTKAHWCCNGLRLLTARQWRAGTAMQSSSVSLEHVSGPPPAHLILLPSSQLYRFQNHTAGRRAVGIRLASLTRQHELQVSLSSPGSLPLPALSEALPNFKPKLTMSPRVIVSFKSIPCWLTLFDRRFSVSLFLPPIRVLPTDVHRDLELCWIKCFIFRWFPFSGIQLTKVFSILKLDVNILKCL